MFSFFDPIREMTFLAVFVRMIAAVVCGGLIGLEREFKRRAAGFRTHILIALGAAISMLTNLYLYQVMHLYTDVARLSAQVITGIGFIGAGTIIVTKHRRVKGLTTAAGLWAAAIIGLACGAGYLECALFSTAMVLLAELVLVKIEYRFMTKQEEARLYVEYKKAECIEKILEVTKRKDTILGDLEITRTSAEEGAPVFCAILTVRGQRKKLDEDLLRDLQALEDVVQVEEV
ncbi:MAG: MgtC/SapB family protein [Oscillospiraceae bacterium]|nr:MgtC/SapB family protein [Oscillospiraceae bacterium]